MFNYFIIFKIVTKIFNLFLINLNNSFVKKKIKYLLLLFFKLNIYFFLI